MRVLISPEALEIMDRDMASDGTRRAIAEAIRHSLDQLRAKEYCFCTHRGAESATTFYKDTSLALRFCAATNTAILFHASEFPKRSRKAFFAALELRSTEFTVV